MVFLGLKPSLFDALCCRVEVIKGGWGLVLRSLDSMLLTLNLSSFILSKIYLALWAFVMVSFSIFEP